MHIRRYWAESLAGTFWVTHVPEVQLPLLPLVLDNVPLGLRLALAQEGIPCQDRAVGMPEGRFVLCDSQRGPAAGRPPARS